MKLKCQLAVLETIQGHGQHLEALGPVQSLVETWTMWKSLWQDFHAAGLRLTFKLIDPEPGYPRGLSYTFSNNYREDLIAAGRGRTPAPISSWCDFGSEGCRVQLGFHKSVRTAENQFIRTWETYGRREPGNCWVETTQPITSQTTPAILNAYVRNRQTLLAAIQNTAAA
jgi:hypothetical protein